MIELLATSRLLTEIAGVDVQPNQAGVGRNAFAHEARIHPDGVRKDAVTYGIARPQDVGHASNERVLGGPSGRPALDVRRRALGHARTGPESDRALARFKDRPDRTRRVTDDDRAAIAEAVLPQSVGGGIRKEADRGT